MKRLDFCVECMEEFRYDDCGGYNPPCRCGFHCQSCHDAVEREAEESDEDHYDHDHYDFPEPSSSDKAAVKKASGPLEGAA